jgi:hypothetical protein
MNPAKASKTITGGATVVSLVSYLEAANERLRQSAMELSVQITALQQKLDRMESEETGSGAGNV